MNKLRVLAMLLLVVAAPAPAQLTIEDLVRDAGLRAGDVEMRDVPGWKGAQKILVVFGWQEAVEMLQREFPDTEFLVPESSEDAIGLAAQVDAIIGSCDAALVAAAKRLVWVQIPWAGVERCLVSPRIASGEVVLTNMQKMSSPVIGEHAVTLALALSHGLPAQAKAMPSGEWRPDSPAARAAVPLAGKTMLVLGLGGIGTETARRGAALGMRVIGTRNSSREGPSYVDYVGLADEMLDLVPQADVIVNALPATDQTRGLLDAEFFAATKRGAYFVNVGRGTTVNTDALLRALQNGQLGGAGLDVTDPEPLPPDHPLWQLDNVIITPHIAGRGGERERHLLLLRENLRRYAAGDALLNVVDPGRGY